MKSETILYLAGPMRGIPLYNFPAFDGFCAELRSAGYAVISPADLDRQHGIDPTQKVSKAEVAAALDRDLEAILTCDGIALMPGWENSCGANTEVKHGVAAGLFVASVQTWLIRAEQLRKNVELIEAAKAESEGVLENAEAVVDILDEAKALTSGDRQQAYDHPHPNHVRIAALWNAYDQAKPEARRGFDGPGDVVAKMILLKLARHVFRQKRDNLVDIAGYARCMAMIDDYVKESPFES